MRSKRTQVRVFELSNRMHGLDFEGLAPGEVERLRELLLDFSHQYPAARFRLSATKGESDYVLWIEDDGENRIRQYAIDFKRYSIKPRMDGSVRVISRQQRDRRDSGDRMIPAAVHRVFHLVELVLPRRLAAEELGDGAEIIGRLALGGEPSWKIHLKVASTIFWVLVNAVRELTGALLGRLKRG